MGTKNNPGKFDCYANADPDEPMFVLLGRDRHAPFLVMLWALLRRKRGEDEAIVNEAMQCANAMEVHAREKAGHEQVNEVGAGFEPMFMEATKGLDEHPEDFGWACQCDLCLSYAD